MRRILMTGLPPLEVQDLAGPLEVFSRCEGYRVDLVSPEASRAIEINLGLQITGASHYRDVTGPVDTLWVVGGPDAPAGAYDVAYLEWLRVTAAQARRVGASCLGTFLLAAAGVLDGKRVVTHWQWCDSLAQQYPSVTVVRDAIYVRDGHIWTSAGITTGLDLALTFVEEDFGRRRALTLAQWLVMFVRRPGSQPQLGRLLTVYAGLRRPFDDLVVWMLEHLSEPLTVESLAAQAGMSVRQFIRVFQREKGMPPGRFLDQLRVETARRMLEESDNGLKEVAALCGFGSVDSMRRAFMRIVGASPASFARRALSADRNGAEALVATRRASR
ncbi:AraC family transcriptional regulator [Luteitalea sp. TBR-22]|uniref:GlxA family transcriptional regulator n=1 Tax=Luteitalea sp. TBR-22 TaxID=2802971 RepID=UPI001AF6EB88|nr:helix-turn-helix domain-containing protein [Luteitalea sp. TBR-22]BCS35689.1 AraC family transcriptional regulator [Luteitalea sp. TBR-22]